MLEIIGQNEEQFKCFVVGFKVMAFFGTLCITAVNLYYNFVSIEIKTEGKLHKKCTFTLLKTFFSKLDLSSGFQPRLYDDEGYKLHAVQSADIKRVKF